MKSEKRRLEHRISSSRIVRSIFGPLLVIAALSSIENVVLKLLPTCLHVTHSLYMKLKRKRNIRKQPLLTYVTSEKNSLRKRLLKSAKMKRKKKTIFLQYKC
jgi:hypothetical protein